MEGRKSSKKEQSDTEQVLLSYVRELEEEMNLRLFLDREGLGEIMLFVESVTITDICYPESKKQGSFLQRVCRTVILMLKKQLRSFLAHMRRLFFFFD